MDKLGLLAGAVSFGGVSSLFKHFATTKSCYLCRGVATLSMGNAFVLGAGVYVVSRVINSRLNPFNKEKQQVAYRLTDAAITLLTGIVANVIVAGLVGELAVTLTAAAVTGASIGLAGFVAVEVAKLVASYFPRTLKLMSLDKAQYDFCVNINKTGNNDFVGVIPESGRVYLASSKAHFSEKSSTELETFWKGEIDGFENKFKQLPIPKSTEEVSTLMMGFLNEQSQKFGKRNQSEQIGTNLIMAQFFTDEKGKKRLYVISLGSNERSIFNEEEGLGRIFLGKPNFIGLGGSITSNDIEERSIEVKPGNKIVLSTGGFFKLLETLAIRQILIEEENLGNISTKLLNCAKKKTKEKIKEEEEEMLNDLPKSLTAFVMIVPE